MTELVPSARWHPPVDLPHVLVVTGGRGYEKEYEVEHPAECARSCPWWPDAPIADALGFLDSIGGAPSMLTYDVERGEPNCYVEWEVGNCGLESLVGELDGRHVDGSRWREDLPPGRYLIAGWYQPSGWAGSEPIEADGGLELVGRERPRWWDVLRPRAVTTWPRRLRVAARSRARRGVAAPLPAVGRVRVCLRDPAMRAYFSERNRHGCVVVPLGRGWRVVLERRKDTSRRRPPAGAEG